MKKLLLAAWLCAGTLSTVYAQVGDTAAYLAGVKAELVKQWPKNRTINLVFHGHSVPSGYFRTPDVRTMDAYPIQVLAAVKERFPNAVVNAITTSIGGENSEQGEKRFKKDVLVHRPDVLFIDYALNDRGIGLERSRKAMEKMIRLALKKHIPVILLTPSPDLQVDLLKDGNILEQHASQLKALAAQYKIGLADSYAAFKAVAAQGQPLKELMAQSNHPNRQGHTLIAQQVLTYFGQL
ncbi:SGNH/GDSL hydrolase family protein [Chitinophaga alhagiae]|uniref:SGNH/GDSL hydrolase family protein n=1 Tax=Chitinophaga alhagiae TaxID=2203219 RepID=UPI001E2A8674|nr:SGNH/GDSL hydrolase family protein [Chitinophaga alhagiae]